MGVRASERREDRGGVDHVQDACGETAQRTVAGSLVRFALECFSLWESRPREEDKLTSLHEDKKQFFSLTS